MNCTLHLLPKIQLKIARFALYGKKSHVRYLVPTQLHIAARHTRNLLEY